jgi:tetratricopeptide (TPR) repeat protein
MQNRAEESAPLFEEALANARMRGDRLSEADALNNLGICADYAGDFARSRELYEESLRLARGIGHDRKTARALHNLCAVMQDLGDLDVAVRYERDAIATIEPWGTPRQFMIDLADLELIRGNVVTAGNIAREALEGLIFQRSVWHVRECLLVLAQIHARAGHDDRAGRLVGFMETLDPRLAPRQPAIQELYVGFIDDLRARLGEPAFSDALRDGGDLTLDSAVKEALQPL